MDPTTRLALAAATGDRTALTEFVRRTQADVWRLCAYLVDAQTADDLVQETYLRAHRSLAGFRADASARTWLLSIARRVCADEIRRRTRARRDQGRVGTSGNSADHAGTVATADLIHSLPEDRRAAFVLTQIVGLSYAEASEVLGVRIGTIRSRVSRARSDLIGCLQEGEKPSATYLAEGL